MMKTSEKTGALRMARHALYSGEALFLFPRCMAGTQNPAFFLAGRLAQQGSSQRRIVLTFLYNYSLIYSSTASHLNSFACCPNLDFYGLFQLLSPNFHFSPPKVIYSSPVSLKYARQRRRHPSCVSSTARYANYIFMGLNMF
jgi:hypothetical protein